MSHETTATLTADQRLAITDCLACRTACLETIEHCKERDADRGEARHISSLQACVEACQAAADALHEQTGSWQALAMRAAEACAQAAVACQPLQDDPAVRACMEACLRCASSLKRIAQPAPVDYDKVAADSYPASDPPSTSARL